MTHLAIEDALLAVMAAHGGDPAAAAGLVTRARQEARATARRERQVVEIAALVVAGDRTRAAGLAREHVVEFPDDAPLLARLAAPPGAWAPGPRVELTGRARARAFEGGDRSRPAP